MSKIKGVVIKVTVKEPKEGQHSTLIDDHPDLKAAHPDLKIKEIPEQMQIRDEKGCIHSFGYNGEIDYSKFHEGQHVIIDEDLRRDLIKMELEIAPNGDRRTWSKQQIQEYKTNLEKLKNSPEYQKKLKEFREKYITDDPEFAPTGSQPGEEE